MHPACLGKCTVCEAQLDGCFGWAALLQLGQGVLKTAQGAMNTKDLKGILEQNVLA